MRAGLAIVAIALVAAFLGIRAAELSFEVRAANARAERNAAAAAAAVERFKVADSLSAASAAALELTRKEAGRREAELMKSLSDMKIRARDARAVTTIATVVRDTVFFPAARPADGGAGDTCIRHVDKWLTLELCKAQGGAASVSYSVRDSVTAIVHVRYRRRFLWWRWRPEYRATVVSHNANSEINGVAAVVVE